MKKKLLSELLTNIRVIERLNFQDRTISHVSHSSLKISDGGLFIAIRGYETDGHKYLGHAAENGASAAVVEKFDNQIPIPQIKVADCRDALARISVNLYREEINRMHLIGITGTNGKTTTAMLLHSVVESAGIKCGLIGTMNYFLGDGLIIIQNKNQWIIYFGKLVDHFDHHFPNLQIS